MKKLLSLLMVSSVLSLSACVESTSAGRNNTTIECSHFDQKVTYTINSSDYMFDRSDSFIRIYTGGERIYYPAHACIITETK